MTTSFATRAYPVLMLGSVVLWWPVLRATFSLAASNDAYTHIFLIVPLCAALIAQEWKSQSLRPLPSPRAGLVLVIAGLLTTLVSHRLLASGVVAPVSHLSLSMTGLVLFWIGSFIGCFGYRLARALAFPLCLLAAAIPAPEWAVRHIVSILQSGSAWSTRMLFTMVGVPVSQDGVTVSIPGLTVEVAQECSSIRSSMMLMVTSAVFAHLLLRSDATKIVVVILTAPLSILKNAIRIFTLSMLTVYVNPNVIHSWLHHQGGIVFFVISLLGLLVLIRIARWAEERSRPRVSQATQLVAGNL